MRRSARVILLAIVAFAFVAPWLAPYDPAAQLDLAALRNAPPSAAHWLGTDAFSRDVLSRALDGTRTSLAVAMAATTIALLAATMWSTLAGMLSTRMGDAMMATLDAVRAIPRPVLLLATLLFVSVSTPTAIAVVLGLTSWMGLARVLVVQVRQVRTREFVTAARAMGAAPLRVVMVHVLPHLTPTLASNGVLLVADLLAFEAAVSFLGLGVRPPRASWGSMLQDGVPTLATAWWTAAVPAGLLVTTVLLLSVAARGVHAARATAVTDRAATSRATSGS